MMIRTKTVNTVQILRCNIGDETYGLEMSFVAGIHGADNLNFDPASQDPVGHLKSWNEEIPVFSLAGILRRGSLARSGGRQYVVVLRGGAGSWGVVVDDVSRAVRVPQENIIPAPSLISDRTGQVFKAIVQLEEASANEAGDGASDNPLEPVNEQRESPSIGSPRDLMLMLSPDRLNPSLPTPLAVTTPRRRFSGRGGSVGDDSKGRQSRRQLLTFATVPFSQEGPNVVCGLSVAQVLEVLEFAPMLPVPLAPTFLLGVANWRRRPVPVIDLGVRLGLSNEPLSYPHRMIVARGIEEHEIVAFPVASEVRMLRFPLPHRPYRKTTPFRRDLSLGVYLHESEMLALPDLQAVLYD